MRLDPGAIAEPVGGIAKPPYDRNQAIGIVHFGIGAFQRAHQAAYTDAALKAGEKGWMIAGVSMRSSEVSEQLNPQEGLYTLTERSERAEDTRVIGSVREVLLAGEDDDAIVDRLASPDCHVVSFTVTEKGYCRTSAGALDFEAARAGFYPLLTRAFARRRATGAPGLTLLSCDNLSSNGTVLGKLMREWLERDDSDLIDWFTDRCTTPDTMVDRIVPASAEEDIDRLQWRIGLRDEGAVFTEPFCQWVIADDFAGPRPSWHKHGAQIVANVAPYETAKLRMLNGAHSFLAYAGLDRGYQFIHEAIADPRLRELASHLMLAEAAPTIEAEEAQNLNAYADALIARFENPALRHRLSQIAMDGSQKIEQRWLKTLAENRRAGRGSCQAILTGIGHWLNHVRGNSRPVDDPLADELRGAWVNAGPDGIVDAIFGDDTFFSSDWSPNVKDRIHITHALGKNFK